ncbi:MAG TPA: translation initiation factor IF-2 [Desulfobacteraceae bacterium]|nr:translation initiation factor IF-2 [Desulfobacteraceae bacterium]HPJ66410.1 translation initiation factor IF-2 [Desulfobacteraceae bacterium]HPQ27332.1 translation initiation factor IF-2 [Desulfobacteraceae bacterium]
MKKVRVYELAKELDMESKTLLEKLTAGGMNIANIMCTLDEREIAKAKDLLSGSVSPVIEEKRVKPSIIRRRKKAHVEPEPPPEDSEVPEKTEVQQHELPLEEAVEEPEKEAEIKEPVETRAEEPELAVEEKTPPDEAVQEAPSADEEPVKKEAVKPVEDKPKRKKAKKKKIDQPARIIKRPEEGPLSETLQKQAEKEKEVSEPYVEQPEPSTLVKAVTEEGAEKEAPSKKKKDKKKRIQDEKRLAEDVTVRHRRREIYERADLYEGREAKPKGRKGGQKGKQAVKKPKHTEITVPKAIKRRIKVQELVTVAELAKAMGIKSTELIKSLLGLGCLVNLNDSIDFDTASVVAVEFGYELELENYEEARFIAPKEDKPEDLKPRPPVVTIMGHVDHGKTSLLDYIRKSNIIGGESGGITQHIGAYYVETEGGDIVFLDTPGHEAFTAMRARGAKVTDLIVLVVAADDGVMPQTKEAINHARAADIPIVVAVNKIDKAGADPDMVKRELAKLELSPEEWGGETIYGNVSAKTGEGVDELLNLVLLQAEMLELLGNPDRKAAGAIIEAKLDKSKGPLATVLIRNGTLKQGDFFVCGECFGRVRSMLDCFGNKMTSAGPSIPVEIHGISGVPMAGDEFIVVQDEKTAKQIIEYRKMKIARQETGKKGAVSLEDLYKKMKEGEVKELNIILKTDVQGSLEALADSLVKQSTEEVKLRIIHSATGSITESDIMLASASGAIVIGFNVRANPRVSDLAEREKVDIRYYDVIYSAVKDIRLAMTGLLEPVFKEQIIGHVDIKEVFRVPKVGVVAGCQVSDGHIDRNSNVRLLRDSVIVFDGKVSSLKRFKEDVKEVQSGYECGIGLENFNDIKPGDIFEVYELEKIEAEL